ncbi:hypothetical protein DRP07_08870 [Archaeoglobales archaeon]|nr:MAG: hypothetical protein DRP07_08870 [Archaeoglobales archaeon]
MTKERVLDYIRKGCEERVEFRPRITTIARELNMSVDEVTQIVKELERDGIVRYESDPSGGTYICPVLSPEEMLEYEIVRFLKEKGKSNVQELSRLLVEDRRKISRAVSRLQEKGKIRFAGEAAHSWIEVA